MNDHVDRYLVQVASQALDALTGEGTWPDRVNNATACLAGGRGRACPKSVEVAIEEAISLSGSSDLIKASKALCDAIEEVFRNAGPESPGDTAGPAWR